MRLAVAFAILGSVLVGMAVRLATQASGAGWLLVALVADLAICLLTLALVYGLRHAGIPVEDRLRRPLWAPVLRVLLLPYHALAGLVLYISSRMTGKPSWPRSPHASTSGGCPSARSGSGWRMPGSPPS